MSHKQLEIKKLEMNTQARVYFRKKDIDKGHCYSHKHCLRNNLSHFDTI